MPAEMVRDSAGRERPAAARVGGPSAYPISAAEHLGRVHVYAIPRPTRCRPIPIIAAALYSFIKRNAPHPAMATFDMPDAARACAPQTSNTPLQALVLLDDPQYVEAYRALAARRAAARADEGPQLTHRPAGHAASAPRRGELSRCAHITTRSYARSRPTRDAATARKA